jgi:biotin transport system substrate-specific component
VTDDADLLREPRSFHPRRLSSRDLALIASFAALIAALGLTPGLYVFSSTVPITLQTLGVMLTGSLLGWRRAALAVGLFLLLVAAGLPLLSGGRGGLSAFTSPSGGYLIGFFFGAAVTGWLVERMWPRYPVWWGFAANVVGGIVVVYLIGVPFLIWQTGLGFGKALWTGAAIFLPGDFSKAVVATIVAAGVHRGYPTIVAEPELVEARRG